MPDVLMVGPFLIKTNWLVTAIAIVAGYWTIKWKLKQTQHDKEVLMDILSNSIILVVVIWKFGPLLTDSGLFFNNPLMILYVTGTATHIWLGLLVSIVYMVIKLKKKNIAWFAFLDILTFGFLAASVVYYVFTPEYGLPTNMPWGISVKDPTVDYHPIHAYQAIVSLTVLIWLWGKSKALRQGEAFGRFLCLYGIGQIVTSLFTRHHTFLLGASLEQVGYIAMFIIGSLLWTRKKAAT
jgi:prolipoprotein diacylglyceryltransferase